MMSRAAVAQVAVRPASQISNDTIDRMKKVADWQLTQSAWDRSVSWERGALFAGLMACYEATKDEKYLDKSRQWAEKFNWHLASDSHHADNNACGQDYMELYFFDEQDPYRYAHFKSVNDTMVDDPTRFYCNVAGGNETWWWCDALFMAPPGLVRLSRALNDPVYTNAMHRMWQDTQDCLYDTTDHLFFRDINYLPPYNYNGEKVFWSRGNGWVLAGTARVLQYLPTDDPHRSNYVTLLQEMSAALAAIQLPDGYWHSDLLSPERYDNPETSGTGFFTFGIAWGINNGLLDEAAYGPTVQAGWEALNAAVVQPNGLLGWVQPVGADPKSTTAATTDVFGVGAYLLAGSEVQKYRLSHDTMSIDYFETCSTDAALRTAWTDGASNATTSHITLGDYGDNFMELTYANDQPPYYSLTGYTFSTPKDFTADNAYYLSVLVRGNPANTPEQMSVRLEDVNGASAVQIMTDTAVVQTPAWMELAFSLSDFAGIDLTQISKLQIGVGLPDAASPTGQGTIRIDNIRLFPCVSAPEDFDGNCQVDMKDLAVLAGQWLDQYAQVVTPADPGTDNLAAYWPLDGNYTDVTGNGYTAQPVGNPVFDAGHAGQSVDFDGTNYLNCQNSADLTLSRGGTISAWIKSSGLSFPWASVVTKGLQSWRLVRNNETSAISFHFNSGSTEYQANGSTPVLDNEWHHLMAVYDASTVRLYVDGQLEASTPAPATMNERTDPVYIGGRSDRPTSRNWTGQIDEVRIYNAALSESNLYYLSGISPAIQIDNPRPADLYADGVIDIKDLQIFASNWLQDVSWP